MKLRAYAKINLSLRVFEKRSDGYHNIESVMQSVSLYDLISIEPLPSGIEVVCDDPQVPSGKDNLAYKAAEMFFKERKQSRIKGVKIGIMKNIPIAAGLAGGSADAAAVLCGLNEMWDAGLKLQKDELKQLGAQVGSDVPFCLVGGTCLVKGRGEIVEPQEPWPKTHFILVNPGFSVSTKWVYNEFDNFHLEALEGIKNDLEPVVASRHSEITEIKELLLRLGCPEVQMSGSGPTVFGAVKDKQKASDIYESVKVKYPKSFLVETVGRGVEG